LERLARLEAQAEERSNTTRPLLDQIIKETISTREALIERLEKVEKEIRLFGRKMDIFNEELLELRHGHRELEEQVSEIKQRPN
jgi:phage shock protein A